MTNATPVPGRKVREFKYLLRGQYPGEDRMKTCGWFKSHQEALFMRDCLLRRCADAQFLISFYPDGIPLAFIKDE